MSAKVRNIGLEGIKPPKKTCEDKQCPWHGSLPVRGRIIEGLSLIHISEPTRRS